MSWAEKEMKWANLVEEVKERGWEILESKTEESSVGRWHVLRFRKDEAVVLLQYIEKLDMLLGSKTEYGTTLGIGSVEEFKKIFEVKDEARKANPEKD